MTTHTAITASDVDAFVGAVTHEIDAVLGSIDPRQVIDSVGAVHNAARVFLSGEGRSGLMGRAFAMRLMQLGLTAYVVGETTTPAVAAGDCLVAVSGSGETHATVRAASLAAELGALVVAVTAHADSSLCHSANMTLLLPAATKHRLASEAATIQPLSSLFDQATHIVFDVMTLALGRVRDVDNATAVARHANTE